MKSAFEERLAALAGEAGLKGAKNLLKQNALRGAWYDHAGILHGVFRNSGGESMHCAVTPGDPPAAECSLCGGRYCEHAAALQMYSGRFRRPPVPEPAPEYYRGLRRDPVSSLLNGGTPGVEVWLDALHIPPHVPSKWEYSVIKVKIRSGQREYMGNVSNLRQLYFDKFLSSTVRWEDLNFHDRQIVRFLALNGEAENSMVTLNAENTAEFFHCLIGFRRFLRDGRPIVVRSEIASPVLLESHGRIAPGLKAGGMILPVAGAQVIAGRSGCWIGISGEYYFVPARCEVTTLRSFFSSNEQKADAESVERYRKNFPFPVISGAKNFSPAARKMRPFLDGIFDANTGELSLQIGFFYTDETGLGTMLLPETGVAAPSLNGAWLRDRESELHLMDRLAMFGFQRTGAIAVLQGVEQIGVFLTGLLPELMKEPEPPVLGSSLIQLYSTGSASELQLKCTLDSTLTNGYRIRYTLAAGSTEAGWEEAEQAALEHRSFLALSPGKVVHIPPALGRFLRASGTILSSIDSAGCRFELPFANAAYFCSMAAEIPGALVPEVVSGPPAVTPATPGFDFCGELRPYQKEGVEFLRRMCDRNLGALLADEMGLGKTVQLIALLASLTGKGSDPALIVCPASLVTNWEREIRRFAPDMRVGIPGGKERKEFWHKYAGNFNVIVISYTLARLDSTAMRECKFSFAVLDEAQHIKNPGSSNAKSCKNIRADHRIVLTGTPLENSSGDLWSIFDFLQPGMLGTLPAFKKRYAELPCNPELQQELKSRTSAFFCRRTKVQVAKELPQRLERTLYCDFAPAQRELYEEILSKGREELAQYGATDVRANASIFNLLLRLRQVCCHPALLPDGMGAKVPSVKSELFMEMVQQSIDSHHKLLVFSQFTSLLALLKNDLDRMEIPYEYLDGSTVDRQSHVDKFNGSPEIPLFLLSLKAGGTGLNLCSADSVLICDPWWNPAVEMQAADRAHRIGQVHPVTISKLVVKDSIEEKIIALQGKKRAIFDAVIGADHLPEKISAAELRALLEK